MHEKSIFSFTVEIISPRFILKHIPVRVAAKAVAVAADVVAVRVDEDLVDYQLVGAEGCVPTAPSLN